jgi:hypothetical protein
LGRSSGREAVTEVISEAMGRHSTIGEAIRKAVTEVISEAMERHSRRPSGRNTYSCSTV